MTRNPNKTTIILLAILVIHPVLLFAMDAALQPVPGMRLRVTSQDHTLNDAPLILMAQEGDTLILRNENHSYIRLSVDDIVSLDVSKRANRNPAYMAYGCVVGGVAGYLVSRLAIEDYGTNEFSPLALLVGLPLGTITGAFLGYYAGKERWESLYLQNAPLSSLTAPCVIHAQIKF